MGRIQTSWSLAKASWGVLGRDRELLWLPVLSFLSWVAVAVVTLGPIFFGARGENALGETEFQLGPIEWVLAFVAYVALAYVTFFFRAAILFAADERLRGGDPTVGSALRGAASRAGRLLPWAIVSVTVSMILRAIAERAGFVGQLVSSLVGLAWGLVTFLVLPILVLEDVSTIDAVKRSAALFKRTWGENVAAQVGFSLLAVVAVVPGLALGAIAVASGVFVVTAVGVVVAVAWVAVASVVVSALSAIFQMALYHYAVSGDVPSGFAGSGLERAFAPRSERRGLGF